MFTTIAQLQEHKHYGWIITGAKSCLAFLFLFAGLMLFVKSAGTPLTPDDLYTSVVVQEYDIDTTTEAIDSHEEFSGTEKDILVIPPITTGTTHGAATVDFKKPVQAIITNVHGTSTDNLASTDWELQTQAVCSQFSQWCDILHFDNDITIQNKYMYTLLSVYLLDMIEKNLTAGKSKLTNTLTSITLRTYVSKDPNEGPCYTERRGCADHTTVVMNLELIKSPGEFAHTLVHEIGGHIIDLGTLDGVARELSDNYREFGEKTFPIDDPSLGYYALSRQGESVRKKGMAKEDFCSLYSMTNMFEDFAECALMFENHNAYFKALAQTNRVMKKKFMWFANLYANGYIFANPKKALEAKKGINVRVRDMTKVTSSDQVAKK